MKYLSIMFALPLLLAAGCAEKPNDTRATLYLAAPGMHCDGCTATVQETLGKMAGVDSVYADLATKEVYVLVDTTQSGREALAQMIDRLGFATAPGEE